MKRLAICFLAASLVWCATVIADRQALSRELIRLHVVAASDTQEDQNIKLRVRDAIVASLQESMKNVTDTQQARTYLQEQLLKLEALANRVLQESGSSDRAVVSLQMEEFATRYYDTFTLPAGIYEALRITIGPGAGQNWWCVVFPTLCVGATVAEFEETAQCAGMQQRLTGALTGEETYEVRFFLLDALGKMENFLHKG